MIFEDDLVDGYDYNPHTCMVEIPYNDYYDMKDKCKENKQLKSQLQQKENIIKEVREMIIKLKNETLIEDTGNTTTGLLYAKPCCRIRLNKIKEILDKEVN